MRGTAAWVLSDVDDFREVMRAEGMSRLLVAQGGAFKGRITRVGLRHLRLMMVEEELPRVAKFDVPADQNLVCFASGVSAPVWGGVRIRPGDLLTLGAGATAHTWTDAPCRWAAIWVPNRELSRYSRALGGKELRFGEKPQFWRPEHSQYRELQRLHAVAMRATASRSAPLADAEAVHGLEQQLIYALIACLSTRPPVACSASLRRRQALARRLEVMLQTEFTDAPNAAGVRQRLHESGRVLDRCCEEQLGMPLDAYLRLIRSAAHRRGGGRANSPVDPDPAGRPLAYSRTRS